MAAQLKYRHYWIFCGAALAVWLSLGWPVLENYVRGNMMRGAPVSELWLVAFGVFGLAAIGGMSPGLRTNLRWVLMLVQVAAAVAMAVFVPWAMMAVFLIITAWQVGMETRPAMALYWVAFQSIAVVVALLQAPLPDICWILGLSLALQLFFAYTAQTARSLAETNRELRSAQAIIANSARNAERLRISRELHDAWGHELTALGLQLEIASHVSQPSPARDHVTQAKDLARALLAKVRDVVGTLRDAERCDLRDALNSLGHSIPTLTIHVDIAPEVQVGPQVAHALMRCAQEAVTNAVKHAKASNLWLRVAREGEGVRLIARNDGNVRPAAARFGTGLLGMRERVESLGGKLAVRAGEEWGFTVDAWLPSAKFQPA